MGGRDRDVRQFFCYQLALADHSTVLVWFSLGRAAEVGEAAWMEGWGYRGDLGPAGEMGMDERIDGNGRRE